MGSYWSYEEIKPDVKTFITDEDSPVIEVRYPIGYMDELKKEIHDLTTYKGNHDEPFYKDGYESA